MLLNEAKERNVLVELNLKGMPTTVGKVEKLDSEHEVVFIERFGSISRLPFSIIEKASSPATYIRKRPGKEASSKDFDVFGKCVNECVDRVIELYESNNGRPDEGMTVNCPNCEMPTTSFACAWKLNNHVHFHCTNCKFGFIQ